MLRPLFSSFGQYHAKEQIEAFAIKIATAEKPYTYIGKIIFDLFIAF